MKPHPCRPYTFLKALFEAISTSYRELVGTPGDECVARRKAGLLTFPITPPDVTAADTYENRLEKYIAVNVVPDSQRCQKMNPHLTAYTSVPTVTAHI